MCLLKGCFIAKQKLRVIRIHLTSFPCTGIVADLQPHCNQRFFTLKRDRRSKKCKIVMTKEIHTQKKKQVDQLVYIILRILKLFLFQQSSLQKQYFFKKLEVEL